MAFAFNLTAVLITVLVPPALLGLIGGALARRRPSIRYAAAVLVVSFAVWAAREFLWPWEQVTESRPFRLQILAGILAGAALGMAVLAAVSRDPRRSRPAA
jgi:hypothetical protein